MSRHRNVRNVDYDDDCACASIHRAHHAYATDDDEDDQQPGMDLGVSPISPSSTLESARKAHTHTHTHTYLMTPL